MKTIKRLTSLIAVLAMAMTMIFSAVSFAEEAATTYSLTLTGTTAGHTLKVYQVMTGDVSGSQGSNAEENTYKLSNAKWANGVSAYTISGTATTVTAGTEVTEAQHEALSTLSEKELADAFTLAAVKTTETSKADKTVISGLEAGYYVVEDATANDKLDDGDSIARTVVQVVGNTEIKAKTGTVTSEKKVEDVNDTTGVTTTGQSATNKLGSDVLGDSADHEIGDSISYTITATLPDNYDDYDTYYLAFVDNMSKGLTYVANSAKIHYGKADTTGTALEPTSAASTEYTDGTKLTWTVADLKKAATLSKTDIVYVTYTAYLNDNAVVGEAGNPNKMHIEYSSNPNSEGEGDHGKTPDDVNIVFTYETVFNKTDGEKPLTGADFKLEKKVGDTWTDVTELGTNAHPKKVTNATEAGDDATQFSFVGLDDGTYRLTETQTPVGYNSIDPIEFTITAEHDIISNSPALTSLAGNGGNKIEFTPNTTAGSLTAEVVNKSGSTLPSTGGMGTTIFYALGAMLVVVAGGLLITRRRVTE